MCAHMEGTASTGAGAREQPADAVVAAKNKTARAAQEEDLGVATLSHRRTAAQEEDLGVATLSHRRTVAYPESTDGRQREGRDVAAARTPEFQALKAAVGEQEDESSWRTRPQHENVRQPRGERQLPGAERAACADGLAGSYVRVRYGALNRLAAADGLGGVTGIPGGGEQQKQQLTEGGDTTLATVGALAVLCTLLAMVLVGALVWLQARDMLQPGMTRKHKTHVTQEKARRSRSPSGEKGTRAKKARGWGQWRPGHQADAACRTRVVPAKDGTVSADSCKKDPAAGGCSPGSEYRNSSIWGRAGVYVLRRRTKAERGEPQRHRVNGGRVYVTDEFYQQRERRPAEAGGDTALAGDRERRIQTGQTHSEMLRYDNPADEDKRSAVDLCGSEGDVLFEHKADDDGPTGQRNRHRCSVNAGSSDSDRKTEQQRRQRQYRWSDQPDRRRKGYAYDTSPRSSNVSCSPSAAWRAAADVSEEGSPPSSSSLSAEEQPAVSRGSSGPEDGFCPLGSSAGTDSTWFSTGVRPVRPSAAVVSLQQQYERKCRDLFTRLGEVVVEDSAKQQRCGAPEGGERRGAAEDAAGTERGSACHADTCNFDRPASLSEEAVAEAEQLLMLLDKMFADIRKDFEDNQPGNITCMIRCCNSLLEKDGLMVLSRCKKVPRLMQKAQSVVETVVPCIWSS